MSRSRIAAVCAAFTVVLAIAASASAATPVPTGITPPALANRTLYRHNDLVLADRQAGLFRAFGFGASPGYALQPGATTSLPTTSPGSVVTGDFLGTGVESAVAAYKCAATDTICLKLDTTTPPAGGTAGWQAEVNTGLGTGPAGTYPLRIVLAAGKLDRLSPGRAQLVIGWMKPSETNGGGYDLDLAVYAVDPTKASPFTAIALSMSPRVTGFSAPPVTIVYPDTCGAGQWNGTSGSPPTGSSTVCAHRMPFSMTVGDFGSPDGQDEVAIAWDQTVLATPTVPAHHITQAAIYKLFGPYANSPMTRSFWPATDVATILQSASFSISLAAGHGFGASYSDPRTDLVLALSYDAPTAPYMVLAIPVEYRTDLGANDFLLSTSGGSSTQFGGCPSASQCVVQGGEVSVAVGDVANLPAASTVPSGVTPATFPSLVAAIPGDIPAGSYSWAVRWVRLGAAGAAPLSTSPLSPASSTATLAQAGGRRIGLPITVPAGWLANIYRAPAGTSAFQFAGSIRAGSSTFDDTLPTGGLGAGVPGNIIPDGRDEIVLARSEPLTTANQATVRLDVLQTLPDGGQTTIAHATKEARGPSSIAPVTVGIGGVDPLPTDPNALPGDFTSSIVLAWEGPGSTSPATTGAPKVWSTHVVDGFRCDRFGSSCLGDGGFRTTGTTWTGADDPLATTYVPSSAVARDPTHFALPDLRGESIRLATPVSRRVSRVPRPKMVIHVPPTQFDRMPPSGTGSFDLVNPMGCFPPTQFVSCWFGDQMDWSVNFEDAATQTLEVKTTKKSGWESAIDANAGINIKAIGLSAEASLKKTFGEDFENTASATKEVTSTTTVATGPQRDTVLLDYTDYQVDDYALLGGTGGGSAVGHIVVVTPVAATTGESYSLDTLATLEPLLGRYFRDHNPGNILSYPDPAAVLSQSDGSEWRGAPHDFAPFAAKTWEVEWKDLTGVNASRSWSSKLEVGGGFGIGGDDGPIKLGLKIDNTTTEGGVAEEATTVSTTMKFKAQNGDVTSGWNFTLAPVIFRDKSTGVLTLDWLIDLPVPNASVRCDAQVTGGWSKYYQGPCDRSTSTPVEIGDPAFAMPFRTVPLWIGPSGPPDLTGWSADRNEALYTPDIQIDAPPSAYANPAGDCNAPCAQLVPTATVPVSATVHNYSLDPVVQRRTAGGAPIPIKVRFFLGGSGGSFTIPIGDGLIAMPDQCPATSYRPLAAPCILPRHAAKASTGWTVPAYAADHLVTIYAVIDPDNQYPELHDWATPWDPRSYLSVADDATAADPIPNNEAWNQFMVGSNPSAPVDAVDLDVAQDGDVVRGLAGSCGHVTCVNVTVQGDRSAKLNSAIARLLLFDGDPRMSSSSTPLVTLAQTQIYPMPQVNRLTLVSDVPLANQPFVVVQPLTHWDGNLANNLGTVSTNVPATSDVPVISPAPGVGLHTACLPGTWSPAPADFTYEWLRDDVLIPGATEQLYPVAEDDGGHSLRCRVTANSPSGAGYAQSAPAPVNAPAAGSPSPLGVPMVTPTPIPGTTVTCETAGWSPAPLRTTYAWFRMGAPPIPIGVGQTYRVQNADHGGAIACQETAQNAAGWHSASSWWTNVQVSPPRLVTPPAISGIPAVGATLTCSTGEWVGDASFTYSFAWSADGLPIPFASTDTHQVTADDVDAAFTCTVTAHDSVGQASATSAPVRKPTVPDPPSLAAAAGDGSATLTITPGADGGLPIDHFTVRCDPACGASPPQTSGTSYLLAGLTNGVTYTITVTAHNGVGDSRASNAVDVTPVAAVPQPTPPDAPTLAATAGDGSASLVITPKGTGGLPIDRYTVHCTPACGAPEPTTSDTRYVLGGLTNGTSYRLTVTAHNSKGESGQSNAVTVVPTRAKPVDDQRPVNVERPYITGAKVEVNAILTCMPGSWRPATAALEYQWLRNGQPIPGETSRTHLYTAADAKASLSCRVTASTTAGSTTLDAPALAIGGIASGVIVPDNQGVSVVPNRVVSRIRGCDVRIRMQAYVPATLAVTLYRKAGKPVKVGKAVIRHYRAAGTRSVCYRLPKKPKGWYAKRSFYWLFAVQRGFKPAKGAHATTHKTVVKIRL